MTPGWPCRAQETTWERTRTVQTPWSLAWSMLSTQTPDSALCLQAALAFTSRVLLFLLLFYVEMGGHCTDIYYAFQTF